MPYYTIPEGLVPSAAKTASGQSDPIEASEYIEGQALLDVTAVSGTNPTLDVVIETSADKAGWFTHATFSQKTGTAKDLKLLSNVGKYLRARWTIGGTTPSFTFSVALVGKGIR